MKKTDRITLIVLRDSSSPPVQFRIYRFIVFLIPLVLFMLSAALAFFYVQYKDQLAEAHRLESAIQNHERTMNRMLVEKDRKIAELQQGLLTLGDEAKAVEQKLDDLRKLESELKKITELQVSAASPDKKRVKTLTASTAGQQAVGGPYYPEDDWEAYIDLSMQQFDTLKAEMDLLGLELAETKHLVEEHQRMMRITPSIWPTNSTRVTSGYGFRSDPFTNVRSFHSGIDIAGNFGDDVYATADGKVISSSYNRAQGNQITIDHSNGIRTQYLHLSERLANVGQRVKKGDVIGKIGSTGRSTGPHLHYEVFRDGINADPSSYMPE